MYKIIIWSLIVVVIIAIGAFAFIIISDSKKVTEAEGRVIVEQDVGEQPVEEPKERDPDVNPFCQKITLENLTDYDYRIYIHQMSHQKMSADVKRGFYEITTERIDWLLEGLNQAELTDRKIYRDILQRWKKGNFTKADQDHNAVWALLDGTVGIATGLMGPKQEEAYVSAMKKKKDYCH